MTQNQLNIIEKPDKNDIEDKFSSETLLNLFIRDSLNRKEKEKEKR